MKERYDIYIGIDPDVEKSGVAELDAYSHTFKKLKAMTFPELLDYLAANHFDCASSIVTPRYLVVIEAGWLNKAHWHLTPRDTRAIAAAKGNAAGRNHEVGRKIAECCEAWGYPYKLVKPLRKCWRGKDGKITHEELAYFTHIEGRTNQEVRDAALLAWNEAGLPIRVQPIKTKRQ